MKKFLPAAFLAAIGVALIGGTASAQVPYPVNPAQADACYGLTQAYRVSGDPSMVRIATDVGCLVVPAPVAPYAVPYTVPVAVPVYVGQQYPVVATYSGQVYTYPRYHRHWR